MPLHIHVHVSHEHDPEIVRLLTEIKQEIKKMPSINDVKDVVAAAAAQVTTAVTDAVTKETGEVVAQIQALKDQIAQGGTISQADLDALVASVQGIAPAATTAIDAISTNDGA